MNTKIFKNRSKEAHVDLGSVHMTVKQPINSVKKKSIDSIKTSNRLFPVMEDQTTVRQNFYFLISGIDVCKQGRNLTRPCSPYKRGPSCYTWSDFSKRAQMKISASGQNFNFHFITLPIKSNFFLIHLLQRVTTLVMWCHLLCSIIYPRQCCHHHAEKHLKCLPLKERW